MYVPLQFVIGHKCCYSFYFVLQSKIENERKFLETVNINGHYFVFNYINMFYCCQDACNLIYIQIFFTEYF